MTGGRVPSLYVALALGACASAPPSRAPVRASAKLAVAAPSSVPTSPAPVPSPCDPRKPAHFTLAHVNDMQARYADRIAGKSRWAYVAGYLRALKSEGPAIVLDAGDDYEKGSLAELRSMGETTRQMIQALPIDARTIGNHDFAYGEAAVVRDVLYSAHPVLAANVGRGEGGGPFAAYARLDVPCVRIGVVGLTTYNYGADDQPTKDPYDGVFRYDDHLWQRLDTEVKKHRAEVDVMIALTHVGQGLDVGLAHAVPAVDIIVGAHSEDLLERPLMFRHGAAVSYVLQAGHYARTLGRADVTVGPDRRVTIDRYRIVNVDETLPVAEDVASLADRLEHDAVPDLHANVASVGAAIPNAKPMADLVWRAVKDRWGADALVLGRDLFWDGLPAGPVTLQRLYESVYVQREPAGSPGFSSLWLVDVSGAQLKVLRSRVITSATSAPPAGASAPVEYAVYAPDAIAPQKKYRLVLDKRALAFPGLAFYGPPRLPEARFGGEIIDVLEAYARARTAAGLAL